MNAPSETDRAIVVGIGSYPRFGVNGTGGNDLQGPVADARCMADWLSNTARARVTLITSTGRPGENWTVDERRPNRQDIEEGFEAYITESLDRQAANQPTRLGNRLYVYMAGHGFAPEPRTLALITANALRDISIPNVLATSWIDWFADQLYFDELVLWMDCCATRTFAYDGGKPLLQKTATRASGRAKVFMGFAAGPSRAAFEGPVGPGGQVRGLFTDRLLRGLKGGATTGDDNVVTTSSLVAYFRNQRALVGDATISNTTGSPTVDPVFPEMDDMVLARSGPPSYKFLVALPDGTPLQIIEYRDNQPALVAECPIINGTATARLGLGIYKAAAPGLEKLFEIGAGTSGEVRLA
jgi:hypothetical protein